MPHPYSFRPGTLLRAVPAFALVCFPTASNIALAQSHSKPKAPVTSPTKVAVDTGNCLTYSFKVGDKHRYKLAAFFVGHFPPIALEGNPPANLEADILYIMTVRKVDAKGAEVEFFADSAEVYLLEKDPGADVIVKEDDKIPVPVSLEQIQKALNVTALIQPNGAVATVSGGDENPIKVDIGFDLRKMFLTILPVIFPAKSVKPGESWTFNDGVLGHKAGATTYKAQLDKVNPAKPGMLTVTQSGQTIVNNKLDKEGNSTEKAADQVGTLTGKVTAEGTVLFAYGKSTAGRTMQVSESRLSMTALLKRTIPDPSAPGKNSETNIDVKARLIVKADDTPQKKTVSSGVPAGTKDKQK